MKGGQQIVFCHERKCSQLFFGGKPLYLLNATHYCLVTKQFATSRACLRINLRKETKMEYLSRGFKSVLGNQQAGSQPSAHETVRIHVFIRDLFCVTLADIDSYRAYTFRLRDCATVLLPQHF